MSEIVYSYRDEAHAYFAALDAMTLPEAVKHLRKVADDPGLIPRTGRACELVLAELTRVHAALDLEVSLRTLGGTPPAVDTNWAPLPSTAPPSASDDRMPAHRRVGLADSRPTTTKDAPDLPASRSSSR